MSKMLVAEKNPHLSITPARYRKVEKKRLNMTETVQIPFVLFP